MKRRAFLQRTSLAFAALGLSEASLSVFANRYTKALADPTNRKLALLVGINQYRNAGLSGCVTDVELQRELLIHRFGFQSADILTLTDQQATRSAIQTAFFTHLNQQAKPGDVVVLHFSGYGGCVNWEPSSTGVQTSLVPVDDLVVDGEVPVVNDLLEETLALMVRSLQTDKVTTILDTSYTYPGKLLQGNLRIRARPTLAPVQPSDAELALREQLLHQLSLSQDSAKPQRRTLDFPGILLTASATQQLATEAHWNGFAAGLFTYALTQALWQAAPATSLRVSFGRAKEQVEQVASPEQQPQLSGQKSQNSPLMPYHLVSSLSVGCDGIVAGIEDNGRGVKLWLAGMPPSLLEQYGTNSLLSCLDASATAAAQPETVQLQVLSREGLMVKAKVLPLDETANAVPLLRVGQPVREQVRVLPRNIGLTVALDSSLERIERVDAVSAFSTIPRVAVAIAGEQAADYLFSKTVAPTQVATTNLVGIVPNPLPSPSSYGLFSIAQDAIPNTTGDGGEAIKLAVRRLVPRLQTLLAAKLLNLSVNEFTSQLAVRATLETLDPQIEPFLRRETLLVAESTPKGAGVPTSDAKGLLSLAAGSRIQYRLENRAAHSLYFLLLWFDSNGQLLTLYSPAQQPVSPAETGFEKLEQTISASQILTLPETSAPFQWTLRSPGLTTTYLICSRAPFSQTLAILEPSLRSAGDTPALYSLANPLEVAQAVLQDLHQASQPAAQVAGAAADTFALDVNAWAALRFVYQIL
jgi:hypothetical protein